MLLERCKGTFTYNAANKTHTRAIGPEPPERLECLTKPHEKGTVSRFGTRIGAGGSLSQHLEPAQRKKCAGISRWVYYAR